MGRAEERRKAKDWNKKNKSFQEKTRVYSQFKNEVRQIALVDALELFTSCGVVTLHDKFGFGEKRLQKFIHESSNQMECIFADTIKRQEMVELARELAKLPFDWREPKGGRE